MPGSIRFHLDENVDHAITDGLQRHGVDVTVTSEIGLLRATDDVQLAFAQDNTRVMVTHDEIFR
jgi:predicted nuclease of predicted toxin-antitoxin system